MSWAEQRWERIAQGLFVTGALFVIFTAYGIYSRDDIRGVIMTIVPGAVCFGLWYLARARLDWLVSGVKPPLPIMILSGVIGFGGVAFIVIAVLVAPAPHAAARHDQQPIQHLELDRSSFEEVDVPLANGGTIRSLRRKQPTECPEG